MNNAYDLIEKLISENNDLKANNYTLEYVINYYESVLRKYDLENFILERKTKNE